MLKRESLIALLLALAGIYGPLVMADPVLTRDDRALLTPLVHLHGFGDYVAAWRAGDILDLQPLRDASFVADLALTRATGFGTSHATNLLLWLIIVALTYRLMRLEHGDTPAVLLGVLPFAVHPVFVGSVAWIAARKHLLACAFILGATLLFERCRRETRVTTWAAVTIVLLYLAATLSQPIVVLWPVWAALVLFLERPPRSRRLILALIACAGVMLAVTAANLAYYTGGYDQLTSTAKFSGDEIPAGIRLLALGRYFANFVWPTALAAQYTPGSRSEIAGLLASVALAFAVFRFVPRRSGLVWGAFYFLTLAPMTLRVTNTYVSDTYALLSGVALLSLLLMVVHGVTQRWPGLSVPMTVATVGLIVAAGILAAQEARSWSSDEALWAHAYQVDSSPSNTAMHASYVLRAGQVEEAERLMSTIPRGLWVGSTATVLSHAIFDSNALTADVKVRLLESEPASLWRNYFLARLHADAGHFDAANALMRATLADHPRFGAELPTVAADARHFCERSGAGDCELLSTAFRQSEGRWDEEKYRARLAQVRGR